MKIVTICFAVALAGCSTAQMARLESGLAGANSAVAKASETLQSVCPFLQGVADMAAGAVSPNRQNAYNQAIAAFNVACSSPVTDVVSAAVVAFAAFKAAQAAGIKPVVVTPAVVVTR